VTVTSQMASVQPTTLRGRLWPNGAKFTSLLVGGGLTGLVILAALVSFVWTPHDPVAIDIGLQLLGPSTEYWLGTDHFGRDVVSMILVGARTTLAVGAASVAIGAGVGIGLGLVASARGGWTEEIIMRLSDFSFAFPAILSAILITAILGPGTLTAILAIGIFNVPVFARLTRAAANGIWGREYVLAAQAIGKSRGRITVGHVLPNISGVLIVQGTVSFAIAILAEAALSYLGLGTQPPDPSWGRMLFEAQSFVFQAPRLAIFPGIAIAIVVLGLNLLGDGLRDAMDPRQNANL
jgi:peptide/nickel transport system permease protein